MPERVALSALSRRLESAARGIHILGELALPAQARDEFLSSWQRGNPAQPQLHRPAQVHTDARAELTRIAADARGSDPAWGVLRESALSYIDAIDLVNSQGTPAFTELSQKIYGRPVSNVNWMGHSPIEVARYLIHEADRFRLSTENLGDERVVSAAEVKRTLDAGIAAAFGDAAIPVILSTDLASKAAAGGSRVRLRADAEFSIYDAGQLLEHEVLIHSLTALNGRQQSVLPSLGLGAPRTTATQEGLATFAETITGHMDLARMKRISLRILAIDQALSGANFIETFRFFVDSGQSEEESFNSTARIFRGGDVNGRYPFTKDAVYAEGWLSVMAFFVWSLRNNRLDLARHLFCGRVHLSDVFTLSEPDGTDYLDEPHYLPDWFRNIGTLAGTLATMNLMTGLHIAEDLCVDVFRNSGPE